MAMFDQLTTVENRFEAMGARMSDPSLTSDPRQFAEFMREYKHLEQVVEAYRTWRTLSDELEGAREMLAETQTLRDFIIRSP